MEHLLGKKILHYQIDEQVGKGGMGIVYKAFDTKLQRDVAIKFLPEHIMANSKEGERFMVEAQAAAALNHPNIATIHAIEEDSKPKADDNTRFIVMEFINGHELKDIIEEKRLTVDQAIDIAIQIARGLQAAHKKNIIHRDIKSSNIMIAEDGQAKIMDFGLAKIADKSLVTVEGTTLGTLAYMSPEQAQGYPADNRSDIWSFGVVFYEMLTGELPLKAEHKGAWTYVIVNEKPEKPSSLNSTISTKLDDIVLKMMEKDPKHRFQYAGEVLKSLMELKSGVTEKKEDDSKVIAVLPFENISPDKDADYFAAGLAEELIINLSKIKDMSVVSRTTTAQYKDTNKDIKTIGRELEARYIMEGSVRKFQDNLRISVQLIDVAKGTQLWSETYKGKVEDVFDIQEQVSKQIADALLLKLSPQEKITLTKRATLNAEAFDYNLRAREFLNQRSMTKIKVAIQLFEKALELDPRYANAYAGLSESFATLYQVFDKKSEWLDKAIESGMKALMYDSSLSEAYASMSLCYFNKQEYNEALESSKKAIDLDPHNYIAHWTIGRIYHSTDQDKEAQQYFTRVIEINPDFYVAYSDLLMIYERLNEKQNYDQLLKAELQVYPRYLIQFPDDARARMFYAIALAQVDKIEDAKIQAANALELNPNDSLMIYNAACFYSRIGDKQKGVELLKKSIEAGHQDYEWFKRDTDLDTIREEPGYIELMKDK